MLAGFLCLSQNTWEKPLKEGNIYLGSGLQRFDGKKSTVCSGPVVKQGITAGRSDWNNNNNNNNNIILNLLNMSSWKYTKRGERKGQGTRYLSTISMTYFLQLDPTARWLCQPPIASTGYQPSFVHMAFGKITDSNCRAFRSQPQNLVLPWESQMHIQESTSLHQ